MNPSVRIDEMFSELARMQMGRDTGLRDMEASRRRNMGVETRSPSSCVLGNSRARHGVALL